MQGDADYNRWPILIDALRDADATDAELIPVHQWLIQCDASRDDARLAWADLVGGERGEFVKVQVELARTPELIGVSQPCTELEWNNQFPPHIRRDKRWECTDPRTRKGIVHFKAMNPRWDELRRCERELWGSWPDENDMRAKIRQECPAIADWVVLPSSLVSWRENVDRIAAVERGFVSSIRCDWADFLRHHAALIWSPSQTVEVPCIDCNRPAYCSKCKDRHRVNIPRPFVSTAQPIERCEFRDFPFVQSHDEGPDVLYTTDGYRFDRVKCGTCDGRGGMDDPNGPPGREHWFSCSTCHGRPLNLWRCDAWPGVGFVMPGSERPFTITIDEVANARFDEWLNDTNREIATALGVPPELVAGGR